ncbi:Histone deacetylase family protein [Dioscorea alata]|uniref:Histone deacetylase family protein n=1 Tax=Dioscorea alata TaxID=55571 RepID=A0ACB7UWU4_DIOAL|nr:Histone deacetylase family protein [Dioscorea alata]
MGSNEDRRPRRPPVGLLYDERMCRHSTADGEPHPECPDRIRSIWEKLKSEGIPQRCVVLNGKEAEDEHIASVHTNGHIKLIKAISSEQFDSRRDKIASKLDSIYLNKGSSEAAYLAAGSVVEVCKRVAEGELSSGFAIVRPPGHHAEADEAMGFCLFNNIAIGANFLLDKPELGIKKILIVDWDVHHGNGTQKMFYKDPRVLFFSVHRFDFGSFYPAGLDGAYCMIGEGPGAGYNINVPWEHGYCGDADYNVIWDHVLIPIVKDYNPDIILISAGFDAAINDPLGGCRITPYGYSLLLTKLMQFAQGKIVMALEGGYNLTSLANSVLACVKTLLEEKTINGSLRDHPFESTWRVIQQVRHELKSFWPSLALEIPQELLACSRTLTQAQLNYYAGSDSDVENEEGPSSEVFSANVVEGVEDMIQPFLFLSVDEDKLGETKTSDHKSNNLDSSERHTVPEASDSRDIYKNISSWRIAYSKIDIWYATFGSNMWEPRFLCYIRGGQVEGMSQPCHGSRDESLPKAVMWKTFPHRLFFARSHSVTWGTGGVAFLLPEGNNNEKVHMCLYRITLEQFNDILLQENVAVQHRDTPLFDLSSLQFVSENKSKVLEELKCGWYPNVLYLGKDDNLPILTMTCPLSTVEECKSGKLPMIGASKEYMKVLVKGLVEGKQFTQDDAIAYINQAAAKSL